MMKQSHLNEHNEGKADIQRDIPSAVEALRKSESTKVLASTVGGAAIGNLVVPGVGGIVGGAIGGALGLAGGVLSSIFATPKEHKEEVIPEEKGKEQGKVQGKEGDNE